MSEIKFADGVKIKKIADTLYSVSIKFETFADWAFKNKNENGYLNLNICKAKDKESWYCKLNEWKPNKQNDSSDTVEFVGPEEIPF